MKLKPTFSTKEAFWIKGTPSSRKKEKLLYLTIVFFDTKCIWFEMDPMCLIKQCSISLSALLEVSVPLVWNVLLQFYVVGSILFPFLNFKCSFSLCLVKISLHIYCFKKNIFIYVFRRLPVQIA